MLYKFKCKWYDESVKNEEVTTFGIIGGCQLPEAIRKICDRIIDEESIIELTITPLTDDDFLVLDKEENFNKMLSECWNLY
jgi:hypothetical protein